MKKMKSKFFGEYVLRYIGAVRYTSDTLWPIPEVTFREGAIVETAVNEYPPSTL